MVESKSSNLAQRRLIQKAAVRDAILARPRVYCPTCGHEMPRINRQPIPATLQVTWPHMIVLERRLMAGIILDHLQGNHYREWRGLQMAEIANMGYRQIHNALRRLVPCGWITRVSRGLYRVTPHAVDQLTWIRPNWTIAVALKYAQAQRQERK